MNEQKQTMSNKNGGTNWLSLASGVLLIIGGFIAFYRPGASLVAIAFYVGLTVLLSGFACIASYFAVSKATDGNTKAPLGILIFGILDIIFGITMLSNSIITAATLPTVIGIWVIFSAISKFFFAYHTKDENKGAFTLAILSGIWSLFVAYIFLFNPVIGAFTIVYCLGIYLIASGVVRISVAFR